jgi:hypothetical protein
MIPRVDCEHNTLMFGSGDYYIFCQDCNARWGALRDGVPEYEFGSDGKIRVGCDPTVCTNTKPLSGILRKC